MSDMDVGIDNENVYEDYLKGAIMQDWRPADAAHCEFECCLNVLAPDAVEVSPRRLIQLLLKSNITFRLR